LRSAQRGVSPVCLGQSFKIIQVFEYSACFPVYFKMLRTDDIHSYTDPFLVFLPQTHTDGHRQISENGIRRISRKYAVKNQNWITIYRQ